MTIPHVGTDWVTIHMGKNVVTILHMVHLGDDSSYIIFFITLLFNITL